MTDHTANGTLNYAANGMLISDAAAALAREEESKKEKKKRKKKEKKEQRELSEQLEPSHPRLDGHVPQKEEVQVKDFPALEIRAWLRPVSRTLDTHRVLTAHKSSFLIGINCLMLAVSAHALYVGLQAGPLGWAMVPLALTNLLSLTFAILSAQIRNKPTTLDELWSMSADDYEPAVAAMLQDKKRVYESLSSDLHLLGADLNRRQKHLRTAYNVLLGGVILSAGLFAICLAIGNKA